MMFTSRRGTAKSHSYLGVSDIPDLDSTTLFSVFWNARLLLRRASSAELSSRIAEANPDALLHLVGAMFACDGSDQWFAQKRRLLETLDPRLQYADDHPIRPFQRVITAIAEQAHRAVMNEATGMLMTFNNATSLRIDPAQGVREVREMFKPAGFLGGVLNEGEEGYEAVLNHVRGQYANLLGFGVMQKEVQEHSTEFSPPDDVVDRNAGMASFGYADSFLLAKPGNSHAALATFSARLDER
jgi:hypothetical protein